MKKIILLIILSLQYTFAQTIEVTYSINVDGKGFESPKKEVLDAIANAVKIANNVKAQLLISDNKSSFIVLRTLTPEDGLEEITAIEGFIGSNDYYTDLDNKKLYCKKDDGTITIADAAKLDWELSNETKIIDQFTCFKAILKQDGTNYFGKKTTFITEAWYAPALPYAFGPKGFNGLPGLILELKTKRTTFLASKIVTLSALKPITFPKGPFVDAVEYKKKIRANFGM